MNRYLVKVKLKRYPWTEAKGLYLGVSKPKKITLSATSIKQAREKVWEYTPKTFFHYGEYKIIETKKI